MAGVGGEGTPFETGVAGGRAVLQGPPAFWSYSSLKDIEGCPQRYVLSRASYPELWEGKGYPSVPSRAALFGDIVHDALDRLVKALSRAGCDSLRAPGAIEVLKGLGGYPAVVRQAMKQRLSRLEGNPRLSPEALARLTRALGDRLEEARGQVQEYLSRMSFPSGAASAAAAADTDVAEEGGPAFGRRPASHGTHPEITLADEELRFMGRIDLLTVAADGAAITDYKTGAEDQGHRDQVDLYALLWSRDEVVNPGGVPVAELIIAYPHRDVRLSARDITDPNVLAQSLRERIAAADADAVALPPEARPSAEQCGFCPVRGLCDRYWSSVPDPAQLGDGSWFDYEGIVGNANGVRSRWLLHPGSGEKQLLLRTLPSAPPLPEGATVRLLGLRREGDPDTPATVAVLGSATEVLTLLP